MSFVISVNQGTSELLGYSKLHKVSSRLQISGNLLSNGVSTDNLKSHLNTEFTMTILRASRFGVRIPLGARHVSFLETVRKGPGAYPVPSRWVSGFFTGSKAAGA